MRSSSPEHDATAMVGFWVAVPCSQNTAEEIYLRRNATPIHAFSETDRLMARPQEFAARRSSHQCASLLARLAAFRNHAS